MRSLAVLHGVEFGDNRRLLNWEINPGETWAIMGPPGTDKTYLLNILTKVRKAARGTIDIKPSTRAHLPTEPKRLTPQSYATSLAGRRSTTDVANALVALSISQVRRAVRSDLSDRERRLTSLLPLLLAPKDLLVIDRTLDLLDPWSLSSAWDALNKARGDDRSLVIATERADIGSQCSHILVLGSRGVRFSGALDALLRSEPDELVVQTDDPAASTALVKPFALDVRPSPNGIVITAERGQELAARLLTEGYGAVRAVVHRPRELLEFLLASRDF